MKANKIILLSAVIVSAATILNSCTQEAPFEMNDGEGILELSTEYKSDVKIISRANTIENYTEEQLNEKLMVYIENDKGVIRKYNKDNKIPDKISLPYGTYVVEGWTGDSVSASWDKKFFRGYQSGIKIGENVNNITLKLNIANVVVAIDPSVLEEQIGDLKISDLKIKVYHSRGERIFTEKEIKAGNRAYFMMPSIDSKLNVKVEGKVGDKDFNLPREVEDVDRGHLYNLKLSSEAQPESQQGALVKLEIEDIPLYEYTFEILPPPSIKATYGTNQEPVDDFEDPIIITDEALSDINVKVVAYGSLKNLKLTFNDKFKEDIKSKTVSGNSDSDFSSLASNGINVNITSKNVESAETDNKDDEKGVDIYEANISFTTSFLNALEENEGAYTVDIEATDGRDYTKPVELKILRSDVPTMSLSGEEISANNQTALLAGSAKLTLPLYKDDAKDYGVLYRIKDSEDEFEQVPADNLTKSRAGSQTFTVTLPRLEADTEYEYKTYCDEFIETTPKTFRTESKYQIPNYDMNEWSTSDDIKSNTVIPNANNQRSFWDTGNHGSMMVGKTLTSGDTSFINGNTVAKLQSQSIVGVLAAGNLFTGTFLSRDGTKGANLNFGREYNGSHPSALTVKVNYRPGTVNVVKSDKADLENGKLDKGQIFIALASGISELHTAKGVMFDPKGDNILAYGEITWNENVGNDNALADIRIPIKYYEKSKTTPATHIIIVCSASKYGDYFSGSSSSLMYVDDFELEYDDIQFE